MIKVIGPTDRVWLSKSLNFFLSTKLLSEHLSRLNFTQITFFCSISIIQGTSTRARENSFDSICRWVIVSSVFLLEPLNHITALLPTGAETMTRQMFMCIDEVLQVVPKIKTRKKITFQIFYKKRGPMKKKFEKKIKFFVNIQNSSFILRNFTIPKIETRKIITLQIFKWQKRQENFFWER